MWAVLLGTPVSPWTVVLILCVFICALRFPKASASEKDAQSVYKCPYPEAPDPDQHNKFLDGLNGARIVFIGDSITSPWDNLAAPDPDQHQKFLNGLNGTRIVFIGYSITSFLAKGLCPGMENESRKQEYTDLYHPRGVWDDYYRESSRSLNTAITVETCFCEEAKTQPEIRAFTYKDEQGRKIEIDFMFYEVESSRPLQSYIQNASLQMNLRPSVVVLNYGFWMTGSGRDCGRAKGLHCPHIPEVCEFLNGDHEFQLIWQTTSPKWNIGDTITDHHLHIPHACNLDPSMVLHRGLIVHALEPDVAKRQPLYHDLLHFSPLAYHAFNGVLLEMISSRVRS